MPSIRRAFTLLVTALLATGVAVATASPALAAVTETTGSVAHTWTNYTNAGGTQGPSIGANQTVDIACKLPGFRVADGNTWWYQIASSPWNEQFYVSADAFYNTPGQTSGSLVGTPFMDPAVPDCGAATPPPTPAPPSNPTVQLAQGPAHGSAYRYAITLSGFTPGSAVSLNCFDSASPNGFYPFSLTVDGSGSAYTASYCFSGDGPDHWVVANGTVTSNHVTWGTGGTGWTGGTGGTGWTGGTGGTGGTASSSSSSSPSGGGPSDVTTDELCSRLTGSMHTTNAFGGSSTKFDHTASLYAWCGGFGAESGSFHPTPAMVCTVLAVAASAGATGYKVRDLCDKVSAVENGFEQDLVEGFGEIACGFLADYLAGEVGVFAAGATSETGPAAVAVGVRTFRAVEMVGTAVCGGLFRGAFQFGVDLETKHEHAITVDVVRNGKCIYERQIFGQVFWSAGVC